MSMRHSATHGASIAGGQTVGVGLLVRLRSHTRWIIVSTIAALVLVATPAFAGVPASEPSGCNTVATNGWYYSCWVSNNSADPDRISDFSTAIQTVLSYNWQSNDNPSGIDGYFGTNSYNGTKQFQTNHSISSDGIVGQTTWNYLQQDLDYDGWLRLLARGKQLGIPLPSEDGNGGVGCVEVQERLLGLGPDRPVEIVGQAVSEDA